MSKFLKNLLSSRYSVLISFYFLFILLSFIVRLSLICICWKNAHLDLWQIITVFFKGFFFDTGIVTFFSILYSIYLLILPQKLNNTIVNKIITYIGFFIVIIIIMFSFFAEFTFWIEFESRFNFIAVDYLIYTFEVINNINESYPLPFLISAMVTISGLIVFLFIKFNIFEKSFNSETFFLKRIIATILIVIISGFYILFVDNGITDTSNNRYYNELSKAGIYSFFAAYKNNELNYNDFYTVENIDTAFTIVKNELIEKNVDYIEPGNSILRQVNSNDSTIIYPNVIMITVESLSASFMTQFGNDQNITPILDSLSKQGIFFTNMFATGTRTVRGMEALTLAIPPSPGHSVVRRPNSEGLFSVGSVFKNQGYECSFFYGGDGYFDNMNQFFGTNGFNIVDRGRKSLIGDKLNTTRTFIPDEDVTFENAWGMCDEDVYNVVIKNADVMNDAGKRFFNFVMTTSNHRPYTYPADKIDIPCGSRKGAVKYTDYAIGEFIKKAKTKPWFSNTVFIIVADHCANSAGKDEIDVAHYHIPCLIYNLPNVSPKEIDKLCSQIDLYPTFLSYLGWDYKANWYGKNVLHPEYQSRCFIGTYQTLGYLQTDTLVILRPQQKVDCFKWDKNTDTQRNINNDDTLVKKAIAYYQTAYFLFKNGFMKER